LGVQDTRDKFLRLQADFDNFRKRTAGEKDALRTSVKADTVGELLPLVDNFELAKTQLKLESEGEKKVDAAYQGLYKQMVEIFRGLGLEAVPGVGSPFDPSLHDAIMREASDQVPDGTVLEEFRKGFTLGDRLLRPAMVKVSYNDAAPAAPQPDSSAAADAAASDGSSSGDSSA
jgi:molecular chaperone GrpE